MTDEEFDKAHPWVEAEVQACVPTMGGALTVQRVEAGWDVHLRCKRYCAYPSDRSYWPGDIVRHRCSAPPGTPHGGLQLVCKAEDPIGLGKLREAR